ncbi:hypothetical protein llap_2646 [Limosa lapponica baueri]|uniref:Uncharacterized protein n=1 Tax=Limosa lapponica baueri TaxID=1758121 RepID=A0A2I0ULV7_LIMLA|nr:hypothetical protein llap_2646 [Limosa lapponica baueri]
MFKQGHVEPVALDHVQMTFEYFQGWIVHNIHGQPVPVLGHHHNEKVFPDVQREPPELQVEPSASGPVPYFSAHQYTYKKLIHLISKINGGGTHLAKDICDGDINI